MKRALAVVVLFIGCATGHLHPTSDERAEKPQPFENEREYQEALTKSLELSTSAAESRAITHIVKLGYTTGAVEGGHQRDEWIALRSIVGCMAGISYLSGIRVGSSYKNAKCPMPPNGDPHRAELYLSARTRMQTQFADAPPPTQQAFLLAYDYAYEAGYQRVGRELRPDENHLYFVGACAMTAKSLPPESALTAQEDTEMGAACEAAYQRSHN